jgi:hypothetical protein
VAARTTYARGASRLKISCGPSPCPPKGSSRWLTLCVATSMPAIVVIAKRPSRISRIRSSSWRSPTFRPITWCTYAKSKRGLRKAALRIYHIQREEFLPSAYAMIVSFVIMIR